MRDGRRRDEKTFTSIDGNAFGGNRYPGYCSETRPRYTCSASGISFSVGLLDVESGLGCAFGTVNRSGLLFDCTGFSVCDLGGDWYDCGVLGGSGPGCCRVRKPGCTTVVGDMGGDANDCLGFLGKGEPGGLSPGRGLVGKPGLSKGEANALLFATIEVSDPAGLSIAFKEPAGG
jgi:hypothetical protein